MRNPLRALFETRSGIGSPFDLLKFLARGYSTVSGQDVNETTALNVAAVWTGIQIRSRLFAALPVDVIRKNADGTTTQVPFHPVKQVLLQPNSESLRQTKTEFFGMLEAHRILRGNAYAWKSLVNAGVDGLRVHELIPLHPDRIEVVDAPDEFGPTTYRLHRKSGQVVPLPSNEVLHAKSLTLNGRTGEPFIVALKEVIGGALATQEHANSLWSRDATPSIALRHPKTLSDAAKKSLEDSWERTYGRSKDKRRVAVIEEGMEIEQLSLTPEDGQFLETQQDLRAQIAAALMVPPHLMGLSEKATSWGTGIAQLNVGLLTYTLAPDVTGWEERLVMDLITKPDFYQIKFNVRALLKGDLASQIDALVKGIQGGIYSVNDALGWLDMNPIAGGDVHLQPVNYAPLGYVPVKSAPQETV